MTMEWQGHRIFVAGNLVVSVYPGFKLSRFLLGIELGRIPSEQFLQIGLALGPLYLGVALFPVEMDR